MFAVVLLLRRVVEDPKRRLTVTAVATICAFVNVPIVYMSVKWWRTLHQEWSNPSTVETSMVLPLRIAAFGMLFLDLGLVVIRWRTIRSQLLAESAAPDLPAVPAQLDLDALSGKEG